MNKSSSLFVLMVLSTPMLSACIADSVQTTVDNSQEVSDLAWPLHGNNDGERKGLKELMPQIVDGPLRLTLGGKTILVHHFFEWCKPEDVEESDIIVTGHSHEVVNRLEDRKLFLNPGECCGWVTGRCTAAILDTEGPSAEVCELEA